MKIKMPAVLALAILLLAWAPGVARAEGYELNYKLNLGNSLFHMRTWNRLEVTVINKDSEDLQGTLTVSLGGHYSQEVFVEAGASAVAVFHLPPSQNWRGNSPVIVLSDSRGRELKRIGIASSDDYQNTKYIGVLGSSTQGLGELVNALPNSFLVRIGPEHLDHLPFAVNFRAIVVNDPEPIMLNARQKENLRCWVEQGGVLVLGGGSGGQRALDLIPAELAPVRARGIGAVGARDLEVLELPVPIPPQNYTVVLGESLGVVLHHSGDIPLLVQNAVGKGVVLWSALDLTAPPLDDMGNSIAFWRKLFLFLPVATQPVVPGESWAFRSIFNAIAQGEATEAISPGKLLLVLLVYILLAGPINWVILRKLDRREWAWVTIPLLAVLFVAGTFAAGRIGMGSERVVYQFNVIEVCSENLAYAESSAGVFTPNRKPVTLVAQADALAAGDGGTVTWTGDGTRISFARPPLWSVQRFYATDYLSLPGNFAVQAVHKGDKVTLAVQVVNNTGYAMFDSYIRLGEHWYRVGPLGAGESRQVDASSLYQVDLHELLRRYSASQFYGWYDIYELLPNASFLFLGFGDGGVIATEGADKVVALDMWFQRLDLDNIAFDQQTADIPRRFLFPEIVAESGNMISGRGDGSYEFIGPGAVELVFAFPPNLDFTQGDFYLNMDPLWGYGSGSLQVYNYARDEWEILTEWDVLLGGAVHSILLEHVEELIYDNRLRVRIEFEGNFGFHRTGMDVSVKGGRFND